MQLNKLRENFESILKPDRNKKTPIGENFKVIFFFKYYLNILRITYNFNSAFKNLLKASLNVFEFKKNNFILDQSSSLDLAR